MANVSVNPKAIAPNLIIYRVATGTSFDSEEVQVLSTIQFTSALAQPSATVQSSEAKESSSTVMEYSGSGTALVSHDQDHIAQAV